MHHYDVQLYKFQVNIVPLGSSCSAAIQNEF